MDMKKVGAPALDRKVVDRLLDLLSTDDDFRRLFQKDAKAALLLAGHQPAASTDGAPAAEVWMCLQLKQGQGLASKASIARDRPKLERTLNAVVNFACPQELLDS